MTITTDTTLQTELTQHPPSHADPKNKSGSKLNSDLHIVYRPIDTLVPYAGNARTHSKKQIRKIRDSIVSFGFVNPVLINAARMIIAGHGRVLAANLHGMTEVPTICLEDLSPDQIRAYVIADNRLAQDAGWFGPFEVFSRHKTRVGTSSLASVLGWAGSHSNFR